MGYSPVMGIAEIPNFPFRNTVRHSSIWEIPLGNLGFCKGTSKMGKVTSPIGKAIVLAILFCFYFYFLIVLLDVCG